jgi:GMP synthase-like glutamine amidotransferase
LAVRIECLQHVPFEGPGAIAKWASLAKHSLHVTGLFRGDPLPSHDDFDVLLVMGGPMSVHDERQYCWLTTEKRYIEQALGAGKHALGICLGAQLLADVLGARVFRAREKEIGWHPIRKRPEAAAAPCTVGFPDACVGFHWHGETFDLPAGAVHLAETDACANQAFEFDGRALGLQFHLEVTPDTVRELAVHCAGDLDGGRYVQSGSELLGSPARFNEIETILFGLLDRLWMTNDTTRSCGEVSRGT